jgi:iron only hydrogenase large subunit-like protein
MEDLNKGLPIRMLIAPAAPFVFEHFPGLLGYLHSLGVEAFYPVFPYADIAVWAYYTILKANPQTKLVCSACAGMNRYLKERREYAGYLSCVFSPLLCAARYLKTYRHIKEPFAFLSPCLLKKTEFVASNNEELVRYNITVHKLYAWLSEKAVDTRQYAPHIPEPSHNGRGLTLAAFGGIGKTLAALLPDIRYHVEYGLGNARSYLTNTEGFGDLQGRALIFEPYACPGGCAGGSGMGTCRKACEMRFMPGNEPQDTKNILRLFSYYDKTLRLEDFCV